VQLTRARVIAAAMTLIEAEGAQAASMTRLATELGCGLVALYSYVPSTQALLDGVASALVSAIEPTVRGGEGWPDQLRAQAQAARRAAAAHPRCAIAVAGRPPATAALLRPAEQVLGTLRAAGFGAPDAVRISRALAAYLVGSLLREVGVSPAVRAEDPEHARPVLRPASFPHLSALSAAPELADCGLDPGADFEFGLDVLLRGVATLPGAHPPSG
jgi:AcrR family transcriptional regulator